MTNPVNRTVAMTIIRDCFAHVKVERIYVEYDHELRGEIAKVVVRNEQLSAALRNNGADAQRAAMATGLNVEVVLDDFGGE